MTSDELTPEECRQIREMYTFDAGFDPLVDKFEIDVETLRNHLYGDCAHDIAVEPIVPPSHRSVSEKECHSFRERVHNGSPIIEFADKVDRPRNTIDRHALGKCDHSNAVPPVSEEEALTRDTVSAEQCRKIRLSYAEADDSNALEFAEQYELDYQVVLTHLNSGCSHDVEAPIRKESERRAHIPAEKCDKIRSAWRADPDARLAEIADEFGVSTKSADRHIKFECGHHSESLLVDEMSQFDKYLQESE